MKAVNIPNQFVNSFVRQMGREYAHDIYKKSTENIISQTKGVKNVRIFTPVNNEYFASFIGFIPFATIYYFIYGIIMFLSNKVVYEEVVEVRNYKPDGRCKSGLRYLGIKEVGGKKFKGNEENKVDLKQYNKEGLKLIGVSFLVAIMKIIVLIMAFMISIQ